MADVKPIAPVRIGSTDIQYRPGDAGRGMAVLHRTHGERFRAWPGLSRLGEPACRLAAPRAGPRRRFHHRPVRQAHRSRKRRPSAHRARRQYYPSAQAVNPYERARKAVLKDYVPPSTSVLMEELLVAGANMDVSMLAVLPGRAPSRRPCSPKPCRSRPIRVDPLAGVRRLRVRLTARCRTTWRSPRSSRRHIVRPMPYGTEPTFACKPNSSSRHGSTRRSRPAAFRSRNAVKAQVDLSTPRPAGVPGRVERNFATIQLTVVATKGLALLESKIEINIFGCATPPRPKKDIITHPKSDHVRLGPAAVRAGDLLCLSALYAADENGALPQAVAAAGLRHFGVPVQHRCAPFSRRPRKILPRERRVARQRAARPPLRVRPQRRLSGAARLARQAVRRAAAVGAVRPPSMPIPGCDVILDAWVYRPGR